MAGISGYKPAIIQVAAGDMHGAFELMAAGMPSAVKLYTLNQTVQAELLRTQVNDKEWCLLLVSATCRYLPQGQGM